MAIQYATGTIVFDNDWTQTGSPSLKTELCSRIYENFITAGWTSQSVVGGAGARTAFTVRCVATATEGLQCEVKCDTTSTNCVRLLMQEVGGTHVQTQGMWILPILGRVWNMVINQHQFFVWAKGTPYDGAGGGSRSVVCGGVLYVPPFLHGLVTIAIWGQSNSSSDTDTNLRNSFRMVLCTYTTGTYSGDSYYNINGTWWEGNSFGDTGTARLVIPGPTLYRWSEPSYQTMRWHDDSTPISDPLMAWGLESSYMEAKIRGQLWDACVSSNARDGDSTMVFDSRTYIAFTNNNYGLNQNWSPGTLWLATT